MKNPATFKPRWEKRGRNIDCYMHGCNEKVYKHTKLASKEIILQTLSCENPDLASLPENYECTESAPLCELHYRALHKLGKPGDYQWKCSACGVGINSCSCKSGCETRRCGCRRKEIICGPGCRCSTCRNLPSTQNNQGANHEFVDILVDMEQTGTVHNTLEESVDEIMERVFGENWNDDTEESSNEEHSSDSDRD